MPSIFLSHSSKDKELAMIIAHDLIEAGIQVWLDEWEILVGDSITQRIQHGLDDVTFVGILWTKHSASSGWVEKEWASRIGDEAEAREVIILPLKADSSPLPRLLCDKKYADFERDYDCGIRDLITAIKGHEKRRELPTKNDNSLTQDDSLINPISGDIKNRRDVSYQVNNNDLVCSWQKHLQFLAEWSQHTDLLDAISEKPLSKLFIDIHATRSLRHYRRPDQKSDSFSAIEYLLNSDKSAVILGDAGMGKTTLLKSLIDHILKGKNTSSTIRQGQVYVERLRRIATDLSLTDNLLRELGIAVKIVFNENVANDIREVYSDEVKEHVLCEYLNKSRTLLLLDGFDELPYDGAVKLAQELERIAEKMTHGRIIITSRFGTSLGELPKFEQLELLSFRDEDIISYVRNRYLDVKDRVAFLAQLQNAPFLDVAIRPLNLVFLCTL